MNDDRIRDKFDLIERLDRGERYKYVFFWGHQPNRDGSIGKTCFSQWFESSFELDGIYYPTAEHYMMAEKARLFGDKNTLTKILDAPNPGAAKKLGREVENFNQDIWLDRRFQIVVDANVGKFGQNDRLKSFLSNTQDRVLVEASPIDRIWGIGLAADDPDVENPANWKGLNLLGFALMEVRDILRA